MYNQKYANQSGRLVTVITGGAWKLRYEGLKVEG